MSRRSLVVAVAVCFLLSLPTLAAPPESLAPRRAADKHRHPRVPPDAAVDHIVIKFHEGTHVRLRGNALITLPPNARERARSAAIGLTPERIKADLIEAHALLTPKRGVRGFHRLFATPEEKLTELRANGEQRSGRELADLDLYYQVDVGSGLIAADVEDLLADLNALPSVEIAYVEPPPQVAGDIFPTTPDFESEQGYLDSAASGGVDAQYAWTVAGGRGSGVKIIDVEVGWRPSHEDLPTLFHQGGAPYQNESREHGTAVLGQIVALDNGYGVTGIANQALMGTERVDGSQVGFGTASRITAATGVLSAGDFIIIELHQQGTWTPNSPCPCSPFTTCDYIPMEIAPATWDAIRAATDNGITVIEAGGNGATDLDDPAYFGWFAPSHDSGAILVAASNSGPDRSPACFSNYGSRIDLHSWGWNVVTLGYGNHPLFNGAGDPNQYYTHDFDGTSSATPIVTGAAADLQGVALARGIGPLEPAQLRQWLKDTGTPQVHGTKHIGPQPNLATAIDRLQCYLLTRSHTGTGSAPTASPANSEGCAAGRYLPGTLIQLTAAPAGGFAVGSWSGTHTNSSTSTANSTTMPAGNHTVSVSYIPTPAPTYTVFSHDFTSTLQGLGLTGLWHQTSSCLAAGSGHSLPTALYFGVDGTCTYETGAAVAGTVTLPPISLKNLSTPIVIGFKYRLGTEAVNGFDLASIEVSADGGPFQAVAGNQPPPGATTLFDPTSSWQSSSADLSAFAGTNARVRFRFDSVDALINNHPGFYVDDVVVTAAACQVAVNLEIQNQSINSMQTFEACDTIFAGANLDVEPGANVTLHAGKRVVFRTGFRVQPGASFKVVAP